MVLKTHGIFTTVPSTGWCWFLSSLGVDYGASSHALVEPTLGCLRGDGPTFREGKILHFWSLQALRFFIFFTWNEFLFSTRVMSKYIKRYKRYGYLGYRQVLKIWTFRNDLYWGHYVRVLLFTNATINVDLGESWMMGMGHLDWIFWSVRILWFATSSLCQKASTSSRVFLMFWGPSLCRNFKATVRDTVSTPWRFT